MSRSGSKSSRRITLIDVAKHAGVSRATASLVLRGSPLVADKTRSKVLSTIQELGYVYNRAAASLRTQQTHSVGLAITDIANPFFAELVVSIESHLDALNYAVLLTNSSDNLEKQSRNLQAMQGYHVDGIIICPAQATTQATLELIKMWKMPCVLVTRYLAESGLDYVGTDNLNGVRMAVEHIIAYGHRRIAFIGGPENSSARRDRFAGYCQALQQGGLAVDSMLTATSPVSREAGFQLMRDLLASHQPPSAAICYNDVVAFGAMLAIQAAGMTPGREISIVGFDDIADAALIRPGLTTVSIMPEKIGEHAVQLLFERIEQPDSPPREIILTPRLIIRDSTGPVV